MGGRNEQGDGRQSCDGVMMHVLSRGMSTRAFPRWNLGRTARLPSRKINSKDRTIRMPDSRPLNLREYASRAKNNIAQMAWDYYSGGSDDETTLAENEAAPGRARLHYRVLADIAMRSTRTTVLGHELSMPVMAAPTAFQKLAHADGELATVRATTMAGTAMILSSLSTVDVEEVLDAAKGPVFFQLYMYRDRNVSRDLIRRVESAGCKAIILTVDAPLLGNRERDERNHRASRGVTVEITATGQLDFGRMRVGVVEVRPRPPGSDPELETCRMASRHHRSPDRDQGLVPTRRRRAMLRLRCRGNRGLQSRRTTTRHLPATFEVLPSICEAVGDRGEIWVDGGIRRGTDVIKALAAGATATLIGRPILWGLADSGEAGVSDVWSIMQRELDLDMALCGCRSIEEITPICLARVQSPERLSRSRRQQYRNRPRLDADIQPAILRDLSTKRIAIDLPGGFGLDSNLHMLTPTGKDPSTLEKRTVTTSQSEATSTNPVDHTKPSSHRDKEHIEHGIVHQRIGHRIESPSVVGTVGDHDPASSRDDLLDTINTDGDPGWLQPASARSVGRM